MQPLQTKLPKPVESMNSPQLQNQQQQKVGPNQIEQDKKKQKTDEKPISRDQKIMHVQQSQIKVEHKVTLGETDTKIFCAKFDYDDKYIAAACENGQIRVYNVQSEKLSYVIHSQKPKTPFSYVRWRQQNAVGNNKTRNVFVTVNADGEIQHWHLNSGKCMDTIVNSQGLDPQLYCIDFNSDASKFVVSGSEPIINIYDEEKRVLDQRLTGEGTVTPGHSSRVYCVKFDKEYPNLVLSGGWDMRVILWDLREGKPVNSIFEPLICGDGIDICDEVILTSSWKQTKQLQLWDISYCKPIETINWDTSLKTSQDPVFLYCGQFSKVDGSLILAGGSNSNEAKLFDRSQYGDKAICAISDLSREVDTVDFSNKGSEFVISGGDGLLRLFSMNIHA